MLSITRGKETEPATKSTQTTGASYLLTNTQSQRVASANATRKHEDGSWEKAKNAGRTSRDEDAKKTSKEKRARLHVTT